MAKTEQAPTDTTTAVDLTPRELVIISNALNAVCHAVNVTETDFPFLIGASPEEGRALLQRIQELLNETDASRARER